MRSRALLLTALSLFAPLTSAGTLCNSSVTNELQACAKSNFAEADKRLNVEYKALSALLPEPQRINLLDVQRDWIRYRNAYCRTAFDATSPGEEAGIDRCSCLQGVTHARTKELTYIRSASGAEDFYHAIAFVSDAYENGSRAKVIRKLNQRPTADTDERLWLTYVQGNCRLTALRLHEDHDVCVARQNFYRDWQ